MLHGATREAVRLIPKQIQTRKAWTHIVLASLVQHSPARLALKTIRRVCVAGRLMLNREDAGAPYDKLNRRQGGELLTQPLLPVATAITVDHALDEAFRYAVHSPGSLADAAHSRRITLKCVGP